MPNVKLYGTTLKQDAISEFYPDNEDFNYFWFQPEKDSSGDYYLKVYAMDKDGNIIKQVTESRDSSPTNIKDITRFIPTGVSIGTTYQLDELGVPKDEKIQFIKLKPRNYKKNYVGYDVKLRRIKP